MARFSSNSATLSPAAATRAIAAGVASVAVAVASALACAPAAAASGPSKVVRYRGYAITVPAAWPVYDLGADPAVCVRFDRHAVYLGTPSPTQRCPAHAVGRTEAILISPQLASTARAGAGAQGPVLPAVRSAAAQGDLGAAARLTLPARGITITASWGRAPAVIERALGVGWKRLLRAAHGPSVRAASAGPRRLGHAAAGYAGLGFDACSAPSSGQMAAWGASPYRAVGIYIGGTNMACSQPNLTSSWVSAETAAGWYLVPIYVGLQAPGNGCGCAAIGPKQAATQGIAAAVDAVTQAQAVGLGPGTPIYFDMEAYQPGGKNTRAVLTFLAAWTTQLHAAGYVSGVYSSGASGIADLVASYGTTYLEPDDIWVADWNGAKTVNDPYLPPADWANHQRLHQYNGGHNETYHHVTINIDGNYLDVGTGVAWTPPPDGTYVQLLGAAPVYVLAGGAPLYVSNYSGGTGLQPPTVLSAQQFKLLRPVPLDGTFLQTSTGGLYRVAGGAPLWVSSWTPFGGQQPYVSIDQWDIDSITDPLAHLNALPANGTWLTTPDGRIYRVVGGTPFPIASWTPYGGVKPSVLIDPWDIQNLSNPATHLLAAPLDGTVVQGMPSTTYWAFQGGRRVQYGFVRSAVRVDDASLTTFPTLAGCVVPKLRNLTFAQARRRLRRSHCQVGKVRHPARSTRASHVVRQWPRPQSMQLPGYAVRMTLG